MSGSATEIVDVIGGPIDSVKAPLPYMPRGIQS